MIFTAASSPFAEAVEHSAVKTLLPSSLTSAGGFRNISTTEDPRTRPLLLADHQRGDPSTNSASEVDELGRPRQDRPRHRPQHFCAPESQENSATNPNPARKAPFRISPPRARLNLDAHHQRADGAGLRPIHAGAGPGGARSLSRRRNSTARRPARSRATGRHPLVRRRPQNTHARRAGSSRSRMHRDLAGAVTLRDAVLRPTISTAGCATRAVTRARGDDRSA